VVLQQAQADLNTTYRNYFASLKGKLKGPKIGPPRFRSRKDTRQAIRFTANARFKILSNGKLRLAKIGDVPVRWSRPLPSEPSSVTVIKDSAGRYFASFVVDTDPGALPEAEPVIGIDLGLKHFAVLSDGRKIASPRFLRRSENKLRRTQRALSRTEKGSRNRDKAWLYGRAFHRIGRFEPTSQTCSACGVKDGPKPLHVRAWPCPACGTWLDRDVNAAVNVAKAAGLAVTACGAQVRPLPYEVAQRSEAGTLRGAV
jgi:putative transposase